MNYGMENHGFVVRHIDESKGVGMFATRRFHPEKVILEEAPLVSAQFAWNEACGYLACHHCMRPLESTQENVRRLTGNQSIVLPYPELCPTKKDDYAFCQDCGMKYCSLLCCKLAESQYHKTLCAINSPHLSELCDAWKTMHYPPETTSIMLILKMIAMLEQSDSKEELMEKFLQFVHSSVDENEGLIVNINLTQEKLESLSALMTKCLKLTYATSLITVDGLKKLFTLIGRNGQGIGTSVYSKWVNAVEERSMSFEERDEVQDFIDNTYKLMEKHVGMEFLNTEGSGLYEYQKCINHSCVPNAYITMPFSTSRLRVISNQIIEAGEEICISYVDECVLERGRYTRNKELKDYYLFECKCERCLSQAGDPDVTSDEEEEDDENEENEEMEM